MVSSDANKSAEDGDCLILYGSQTGQSESISSAVLSEMLNLGLRARLFPLNELDKKAHIVLYFSFVK